MRHAMNPPPRKIEGAKVLEYSIFGEDVERTSKLLIENAGVVSDAKSALAICTRKVINSDFEFFLYTCAKDWRVGGLQTWRSATDSTDETVALIRDHANTLYTNLIWNVVPRSETWLGRLFGR